MVVFKIFYSSPAVFAYEATVNQKLADLIDHELMPMPKHFCWVQSHLSTPYGGQMMVEVHFYNIDLPKAGADVMAYDMRNAIVRKASPLPEAVIGEHVLVTVESHPEAGCANSH